MLGAPLEQPAPILKARGCVLAGLQERIERFGGGARVVAGRFNQLSIDRGGFIVARGLQSQHTRPRQEQRAHGRRVLAGVLDGSVEQLDKDVERAGFQRLRLERQEESSRFARVLARRDQDAERDGQVLPVASASIELEQALGRFALSRSQLQHAPVEPTRQRIVTGRALAQPRAREERLGRSFGIQHARSLHLAQPLEQSGLLLGHGRSCHAPFEHRGERGRVALARRKLFNRAQHRVVELRGLHQLAIVGERLLGLAMSRACRRQPEQRRVLALALGVRQHALQLAEQALVVADFLVCVDQSQVRRPVPRVVDQRDLPRLDRAFQVAELAALQRGHRMQQLAPTRRVFGAIQSGAVQRQTLLRAALLRQQLVHAAQQLRRAGLERQSTAIDVHGLRDVARSHQRVACCAGQREHCGRVDRQIPQRAGESVRSELRLAHAAADLLHQHQPRSERVALLPHGGRESARGKRQRALRIAERCVGRAHGLFQCRQALLRRLGELAARLQHLDQSSRCLFSPVQRLEDVRCFESGLAGSEQLLDRQTAVALRGIGGQRLAERRQRARGIFQARQLQLRQPRIQACSLLGRRELDLALQEPRQLLPLVLHFEERKHSRMRVPRGPVGRDKRTPGGQCGAAIARPGRAEIGGTQRKLTRLFGLARSLRAPFQRVDQSLGIVALFAKGFQSVQRLVGPRRVDQGAPRADRSRGVGGIRLFAQLGQFARGSLSFVGIRLELHDKLERAELRFQCTGLGVQIDQAPRCLQDCAVVLGRLDDLLERGLRALHVTRLDEHIADLGADARANRRVATAGQRALQKSSSVLRFAERQTQPHVALAHVVVAGIPRYHGTQQLQRSGRVVEMILAQDRQATLDVHAPRPAHQPELLFQHRGGVVDAAELLVGVGQRCGRARRDRLVLEQNLRDGLRCLVVGLCREDRFDMRRCALRLAQRAGKQLHQPSVDGKRFLVGRRRIAQQRLLQHACGVLRPSERHVARFQRRPRGDRGRFNAEDTLVDVDRQVVRILGVFHQLGGSAEQHQLLVAIALGARSVHIQLRQLGVLAGFGEQALQHRESLGMTRRDRQHVLRVGDRAVRIAEEVGEERHGVHEQLGLLLGREQLHALVLREVLVGERQLGQQVVAHHGLVELRPQLRVRLALRDAHHQRVEHGIRARERLLQNGFQVVESQFQGS